MMMVTKGLLVLLGLYLTLPGSNGDDRWPTTKSEERDDNSDDQEKSRAIFHLNDESMIHDTLKANHERRNSFVETSTFDPDVLNKFLDEYANKIKSTTEKSIYSSYPYRITTKSPIDVTMDNDDDHDNIGSLGISTTSEDSVTIHGGEPILEGLESLNDTTKRNKFYNSHPNDNRDGWVSLEAIPWSKSKISKWQPNANSQRPWPNNKWEKPSVSKPWPLDHPSRPQYDTKPWYDKPNPHRPDYQSDRPATSSRPSYTNDRYDSSPNQAQKWPPERPSSSWDNLSDGYRPNDDIITDDRPSNFPTSNWDKYDQVTRPTYPSHNDRFPINQHNEATNDWPGLNYPSNPNKFNSLKDKPSFSRPSSLNQRPNFNGQYEYENRYPPSHPSSGDGQWILLSTNRGYSKSRQRALQFDKINDGTLKIVNGTKNYLTKAEDSVIPVMTSKRQVRLTVLPSINGTNTTTSHGGLLEVEKTFKTVDESQKEFAQAEKVSSDKKKLKRRPIRHTVLNRPSNTAVLAAVGAGMLPATMAVMLPIMLGRKKRSAGRNLMNKDNGSGYLDRQHLVEDLGKFRRHQ